MLVDRWDRRIEYLRVSVNDRCNLRCAYCLPEEGAVLLRHGDVLRFEEILRFRVGDSQGCVALIAQMSEPCCGGCDRLRLTSDGRLRPCLFSGDEIDLMPALRPEPRRDAILAALRQATAVEPECLCTRTSRGRRVVGQIGGQGLLGPGGSC